MKPNLRLSFLLFACLAYVLSAQAQLQVFPLGDAPPAQAMPKSGARLKGAPLALPFFEDFSTYFGQPDTSKWINGGAVVGNNFSPNPPSKGVATLNGLKFSGAAYNPDPVIVQSSTDTLTSRPIDLGGANPSSNVLFSFWWSSQSLGETPDPNDSLVLQYKDRNSIWRQVWSKRGNTDATIRDFFTQEILQVNNADFLHGAFQFRFLTFGRASGLYDAWNIDYLILAQNPGFPMNSLRDVTVTRQPKSVLKRYSAMPLEQFLVSPAQEWAAADSTVATNLESTGFFLFPYTYTLTNLTINQEIWRYDSPASGIQIDARVNKPIGAPISNTLTVSGPPPVRLQSKFKINANQTSYDPNIDIARNDTIGRVTVLGDYYAHDDGTAEYGIGLGQARLGSVAVRYALNKPDTLTAIRFYFPRFVQDLAGRTLVVSVWKRLDGKEESKLYEQSFRIIHTDTLNKFVTYALDKDNRGNPPSPERLSKLAVADTFYVGWRQLTNDFISVGYDLNTDSRTEIFYDISGRGQWRAAASEVGLRAGSVMIRPVFGSAPLVTGIEPSNPSSPTAADFQVFPNPTNGMVYWNRPGIRKVTVQDLMGRVLKESLYETNAKMEISTAGLPSGMYVLVFQDARRLYLQKIIVAK